MGACIQCRSQALQQRSRQGADPRKGTAAQETAAGLRALLQMQELTCDNEMSFVQAAMAFYRATL